MGEALFVGFVQGALIYILISVISWIRGRKKNLEKMSKDSIDEVEIEEEDKQRRV